MQDPKAQFTSGPEGIDSAVGCFASCQHLLATKVCSGAFAEFYFRIGFYVAHVARVSQSSVLKSHRCHKPSEFRYAPFGSAHVGRHTV